MAASITIYTQPRQGETYPISPVYNGLPFVVNSNRTTRNNFKYIADVYVDDVKVTTLKHNKNATNIDNGIFDIGRVVEGYIKTDLQNLGTTLPSDNVDAYKKYNVKFGCEYERFLDIKSIGPYASGEYIKITFNNSDHDLRVGDYVYCYGTAHYDGKSIVTNVGTNWVATNKYYLGYTDTTGTLIEGEQFYDNYFYNHPTLGSCIAFIIPTSRATRIKVGDSVIVEQTNYPTLPTVPGYDGEWLVLDVYSATVGGQPYTAIGTNCPYVADTPVNGGIIYSKQKYNFTELATSSSEWAFDGGLQYTEYLQYNPTKFVTLNNTSRFLTNAPTTQKIRLDERATLSVFNWYNTHGVSVNEITNIVFKSYTSGGTLIDTYSRSAGSRLYKRFEFGCGPINLSGNLNLTGASYYTVYLTTASGGQVSQTIRFNIDTICYSYTQKRFKWKNRLGGWDYFTFNLRSDRTTKIDRSDFRRTLKRAEGSGYTYDYNAGYRGLTTFNVNAYDEETVFSNWLSNDEAQWLEELFTSPEVYLIIDNNDTSYGIVPVNILDSDVKIGERENKGLISYSITWRTSYDKIIQRG